MDHVLKLRKTSGSMKCSHAISLTASYIFLDTCHQANVGLIAWEHFMNSLPMDSIKVPDYLHFWSVTNGNG